MARKEYLNKRDLHEEIVKSKEAGELTAKAQQMLQLLANRVIEKMRYYNNYDDRKDCLQEGLLVLFTRWQSFDPTHPRANAFAYYTEVFKRGMAKGFNDLRGKCKDKKMVSLSAIGGDSYNDYD